MTVWFWKKLSYCLGLLAIFVLFFLVVFEANIEIKDLDLWLHLGVGQYITLHQVIPDKDFLSCAIAGKPWINHEWLFQVIVYWFYRLGSFDALITLQTVIVGLTFVLLLFLAYDRKRQLPCIFSLLLVLLIYKLRFTLRPDIFSLLFFSLYIMILGRFLNSKWSLWFLFFLQVLWNNIHGYFIIGPLLVFIALTGEWAKRRLPLPWEWKITGRLNDREYAHLKLMSGVVLLATLINPYFIKGALYPFKVLTSLPVDSKVFFEYIVELQRPIVWPTLFSLNDYGAYKILILLSFLSFVFSFRKIDVGLFTFWLIFLVSSLMAVRNVAFFAVAAYVASMINLQKISFASLLPVKLGHEKFRHYGSIALKIVLIIWMAQYFHSISLHGYYDFDKWERKSEYGGVSLRNYPYKAVDFLVRHQVKGNFLNDFNSGAYLIGRTFPLIKVYIDGRTEEYGADFFRKYRKIWNGDIHLFEEAAAQHKITGVFLNSVYNYIPGKLSRYLFNSPEWALVYFDYDAAIFLKNIPQNEQWINPYRVDLTRWETPKIDLFKIGSQPVTPYQYINRAYGFYSFFLLNKAQAEIHEALKISPAGVETYHLVGKMELKMKRYDKAFENFRKAKILDPSNLLTRYYMALSLYHLGRLAQAKNQCEVILERDHDNPRTMYFLSLILAKEKRYDEAFNMLKQAHQKNPDLVFEEVKVGDLLMEEGQYQKARDVFELALKTRKSRELYQKIGKCYELSGQKKLAELEYQKARQFEGIEKSDDVFDNDDTLD